MKKVEYVKMKWERYNGQELKDRMLVQLQGGFKILNCAYCAEKKEFQYVKEIMWNGVPSYSKRAVAAKEIIEEKSSLKLLNVEVERCCQN